MVFGYAAGEICAEFGIQPRNYQYWLTQGLIIPDVRSKAPRLYGRKESVIIGVAHELSKHFFGFKAAISLLREVVPTIMGDGGVDIESTIVTVCPKGDDMCAFWSVGGKKHAFNLSQRCAMSVGDGETEDGGKRPVAVTLDITAMLNDAYSRVA